MKVVGFCGVSGSGKTTLIEGVIAALKARGQRVSVIKHSHKRFEIDHAGKDTFRHREAGASEVLLAGGARWVLMNELRGCPEPTLAEYVAHFSPCDLVLVEGFKQEAIAKLEVYRLANGTPPLWPENPHIVAVAADVSLALPAHLVQLDLNDVDAIAGFILDTVHLGEEKHAVLR